MKQYSATRARANWFSLLDEVIAGEVVVIERHGRRVVLCREELTPTSLPDYSAVLQTDDVDRADNWTWNWDPDGRAPIASMLIPGCRDTAATTSRPSRS
ncbi:type II toxin-antitoxin system Phd/YefM family antitoxin [bacterium]|nr:type II toxin-antitoxin system Phd/YefM family antitoxin [bacterium]